MIDKTKIQIDTIAFDEEVDDYNFKAFFLKEPKGKAFVEISKAGKTISEFLWPGYKVWNILSHAREIAFDLNNESENGLRIAGYYGLGGTVYAR